MLYQVAFGKKEKYLSKNVANAKVQQIIAGADLPKGGSNYTYSMWFYVNDWNDGFGTPKVIIERRSTKGTCRKIQSQRRPKINLFSESA